MSQARTIDLHAHVCFPAVMGRCGARGGRCMTSGSPGSSMITITGKTEMKKFRKSTISGVIATPLLMSNAVATSRLVSSENARW